MSLHKGKGSVLRRPSQYVGNMTQKWVAVIEPPVEKICIVENIARLVFEKSLSSEALRKLMEEDRDEKYFGFLKSSDPYHAEYQRKAKDEPAAAIGIMKLTAQFVVRYGMRFWGELMNRAHNDLQFAFMEPSDSRFSVFSRLIDAYARVIEPYHHKRLMNLRAVVEGFFKLAQEEKEKEEEGVEMHDFAFVGGLEYFAEREDEDELSAIETQPQPSYPVTFRRLPFPLICPEGVTPKELGIMKLAAQFEARYEDFCEELRERVVDDPRFEFLSSGRSDDFLSQLIGAYSVVLRPLTLRKPRERALEGFLNLFRANKHLGGVEEMAMACLHVFVGHDEDEPPAPDEPDETPKELDVIRLTEEIVGVYGLDFERDLMETVVKNKSSDRYLDLFQKGFEEEES